MIDTISVIIPAYNAERSILSCLESICIAASGYDNIEVLVINDGSTDDTAGIVEQFILTSRCNIKLLYKENGGVSGARNLGLQNASGQWIMFVDADDTLKEDTFNVLLNGYIDNDYSQGAILWMYSYQIVNRNNLRTVILPDEAVEPNVLLSDVYKYKAVYVTTLCTIWNKVYNQRIIRRYNIHFPEDIKIGEDFIFNSAYLQHVKLIRFIPKPLYNYYNTQGSAIDKFYDDYDYYIIAMNKAYSELLNGLSNKTYNAYRLQSGFIANQWLYATWMCIASSHSIQAKVKTLQNWYRKIDIPMISEISQTKNNPYSIIATNRDSGILLYFSVIKLVFRNYYNNMRSRIYKFWANI